MAATGSSATGLRPGEQSARRGSPWKVLWLGVVAGSLVIGGLLGYFAVGRPPASDAEVNRFAQDMMVLGMALRNYKLQHEDWPTNGQGLPALVEEPKEDPVPERWVQMLPELPKDAWGRAYRFQRPARNGSAWEILSAGEDGEWGTKDDMTNMEQ